MNVLITGASGFIGSHLIERVLGDGHLVVALDNTFSKYLKNCQKNPIRKFFKFYRVDLTKASRLKKYFQNIDWVFHLAGRSDIIPSIVDPVSYHNANVTATVHLLEACRKEPIKKFIYAASSSCYGIPDVYPTPESAPIRPQYPYALTKYFGEVYALAWHKLYKIPVVSLRFFNVYGPRARATSDYGPVFSTFMAQKLAGKPYTVVGDGTQTRDFTYVTDVVDAMMVAAKSAVVGEVFNVGSGETVSINRLVTLLGGPVVYIPKRPGEPDCTWADITKIKKMLHWKPKVTFDEGVKKILADISHWKSAPVWTPETIAKATREWFAYLSNANS